MNCSPSALVAFAALCVSLRANGEPARHVELDWSSSAKECITAEELARTVEATLGRPVFHSTSPAAGKIVGVITKRPNGQIEVSLTLLDGHGQVQAKRQLDTAGACERLDESIAVVVALMIDDTSEAPGSLSVSPQPMPRPVPSPTSHTRLGLGAGLGGSYGLLPGAAVHALLYGELSPHGWPSLSLGLRLHLPEDAVREGAGGSFSAWTAELGSCFATDSPRWQLGICGGIGAGTYSGRALSLPDGRDLMRPFLQAQLAPHLQVKLLGPLWLRAEAGVLVPLLRDPWGYDAADGTYVLVHEIAPLVPLGTLSIVLRSKS